MIDYTHSEVQITLYKMRVGKQFPTLFKVRDDEND